MALHSNMLELGTTAPDFSLPDVRTGQTVSRGDFAGQPLLVVFLSRHCPYVQHVESTFADLANKAGADGVGVVAICANDVATHPGDAPDKLAEQAGRVGFDFPYLHDDSQDVALAYTAACTPDFFLFDRDHELAYRGRMDGATPGNEVPVTGDELEAAITAVANGDTPGEQHPSMGCGIKWKPGNEPA